MSGPCLRCILIYEEQPTLLCNVRSRPQRLPTYHYYDNLGIREDHSLKAVGEDDLSKVGGVGRLRGFRGICSLWPLQKGGEANHGRDDEYRDHLCMYLHHSMAHGRGEGGSPINLIGGSWIQNSGTNGRLGGDSQGC
jgi:hypothetical protein